jgi:phage protein U
MVTFDNQSLFGSGPARFKVGPIKLRHTVQHPPGSRGARLDPQGAEAREITQAGVLIADTPGELQDLVDAIEDKVDGLAYTLIDSVGRAWSSVVMLEVDADAFERVGARWKAAYQIEYLQVFV